MSSGENVELIARLRRIEGQVRGLQRMVEDHRDCEEIVTQLLAVRAGLDKVALLTMEHHIADCTAGSAEEARQKLKRAAELLLRLSR